MGDTWDNAWGEGSSLVDVLAEHGGERLARRDDLDSHQVEPVARSGWLERSRCVHLACPTVHRAVRVTFTMHPAVQLANADLQRCQPSELEGHGRVSCGYDPL
jgi:hypothetical protein